MEEKRRLKRWHLVYYLRAFDEETSSLLGHVVDINTEGLKLVSEWPLPVPKVFRVWMEVPRDSGESRRVSLQVRSLWSQRDENPRFYNTGFELIASSSPTTERIAELIDAFKVERGGSES